MKVFALISGGKDSIFNIQKCIENGHQIVALGNLYNYDEAIQEQGIELDSYMYQTVGSNLSIAISQCMQKPLYRQKIIGKPKKTSLHYGGTMEQNQGDEVEDLHLLIEQALIKHPEINAVSSGAIFSSYQKHRVQDICTRFKLQSLAYLWQREQSALLQQMIKFYGNGAIIIKVASFGLGPQHLGRGIEELAPTFNKLEGICGMNVCGEGGEFESLVVDCPLYHRKIVIDEKEQIVSGVGDSVVAYLLIKKYHLQDK